MPVRVALIVGSLREGSYSRAIGLEMKAIAAPGLELELIEIGDLPLYNPDLETDAPPAPWVRFREEVETTEAVLFVTSYQVQRRLVFPHRPAGPSDAPTAPGRLAASQERFSGASERPAQMDITPHHAERTP